MQGTILVIINTADVMEDINVMLSESIDRYFNTLTNSGYVEADTMNNIVVLGGLCFILDNFNDYITDDDIKNIVNAMNCISGNCMIPFSEDITDDSLFHFVRNNGRHRISEDAIIRISEDSLFKII